MLSRYDLANEVREANKVKAYKRNRHNKTTYNNLYSQSKKQITVKKK